MVAEVRENTVPSSVAEWEKEVRTIAAAVNSENGIAVWQLVFIRARTISKTTSGKIQRRNTRDRLAAGQLSVLYTAYPSSAARIASASISETTPSGPQLVDSTQDTLSIEMQKLSQPGDKARLLLRAHGVTDESMLLSDAGLDSIKSVQLQAQLEEYCDMKLSPIELFSLTAQQLIALSSNGPAISAPPSAQPADDVDATFGDSRLPWPLVFLFELFGIAYIILTATAAALPSYHWAQWVFGLDQPLSFIDLGYSGPVLRAQLYGEPIIELCVMRNE